MIKGGILPVIGIVGLWVFITLFNSSLPSWFTSLEANIMFLLVLVIFTVVSILSPLRRWF